MVYYGNNIYVPFLYHHGILGQKWGVRRYQNYDGTYTQAGLARYKQKYSDYEEKRNTLKNARVSYKEGSMSKEDYKTAKKASSESKKAVNQAYKDLKEDNMADKGKKLVETGTTHRSLRSEVSAGKAVLTTASVVGNAYISKAAAAKLSTVVIPAVKSQLLKPTTIATMVTGKAAASEMLATSFFSAAVPALAPAAAASGVLLLGSVAAKTILDSERARQEKQIEAYYKRLEKDKK